MNVKKHIKSYIDYSYFQNIFYYLYILAVVICLSPSKLLAYLVPFIFLFCLIIAWPSDQIFRRIILSILMAGIIISLYGLIYPDLILQNAFLSLFTYSSFIPLIVVPCHLLAGETILQKILVFNQKLLLIEGTLGFAQACYGFLKRRQFSGGNGDYVTGTIYLTLGNTAEAFANPMFAVNMFFACLLAVVAIVKFKYKIYALILGVLSIIVASVVHVFLFGILALIICLALNLIQLIRKPKFFITFVVAGVFIISTALYFIGNDLQLLSHNVDTAEKLGDPKSRITHDTLFVIPDEYPAMPYIGFGPGQFSSRASLIGSGRYFGGFYNPKPVPLISPETSNPMKKFLLPLWAWAAKTKYFGSSQVPYYSWLSIYSEFGLLGVIIVSAVFIFFLAKSSLLRTDKRDYVYKITFQVGIIFLFFLGAQENYWEVPQALFMGVIILKLLYANLFFSESRYKEAT